MLATVVFAGLIDIIVFVMQYFAAILFPASTISD